MKKTVFFFLLACPIFYSGSLPVTDIREQQLWVLLIAAAMFVAINHYNRIFGYAILYCLAHLALFQRPNYMNDMGQILAHAVIYDAVAKYYRGSSYRWAILAVLVLNLFMAGLQIAGQDVFLHVNYQAPGLMTLPVYIGLYAAITAPVIYGICPWLLVLSLAGVVISRSSFAAIAFVAAMGAYFWIRKSRMRWPWVLIMLIGLIGFVGFYDGPTGQFSRRLHIWKMVGSVVAINPWGGWGLGSYNTYIRFVEIGNKEETRKYVTYQPGKPEHVQELMDKIEFVAATEIGNTKVDELRKLKNLQQTVEWFRENGSDIYFWQDPHNGFLLALFVAGIPLLIFCLWYCFDVARRFFLNCKRFHRESDDVLVLFSCFVATVIVTFAHFAIQIPRLSFTIMVLLGLLDQKIGDKHERPHM